MVGSGAGSLWYYDHGSTLRHSGKGTEAQTPEGPDYGTSFHLTNWYTCLPLLILNMKNIYSKTITKSALKAFVNISNAKAEISALHLDNEVTFWRKHLNYLGRNLRGEWREWFS